MENVRNQGIKFVRTKKRRNNLSEQVSEPREKHRYL